MRKVRFYDGSGSVRIGTWTDDGIVEGGYTHDPDEVTILPPVEPTKVLATGRNWQPASSEGTANPDLDGEPDAPRLWFKGGPNVVSGHGETVPIPDTDQILYEAEMAAIIGEQCRNVSVEDARDVISGYTCANDLSNGRSYDSTKPFATEFLSYFRQKSFDNSAVLGPVIADPEDVPEVPRIRLWLNGEKEQDSKHETFIHTIPEIISELSSWVTLEPQDVILTGTPSGVAKLSPGDNVEIEIEGIGRLEHGTRVK